MPPYEAGSPTGACLSAAAPGAAACDLIPRLQSDLEIARPRLVVLETMAGYLTHCMSGTAPYGSPRHVRATVRGVERFVDDARAFGARVALVAPPPVGRLNAPQTKTLKSIEQRLRQDLAGQAGVTFLDAPRDAVAPGGGFAASLACRAEEQDRGGCRNGRIEVRDRVNGVHFCPEPYADEAAILRGCPVYSSGAVRFGEALGHSIEQALGIS